MSQVPNARRARGIRVRGRYQSEASPARPTASPSSQAYSVFRRLEAPRSRVRQANLRARLRQDFSPWPPVLAWVQYAQPLFHRLRSSAFRAYLVSRRLEAAPPVSKPGAHGGAPGPPRLAVREACKAGAGGAGRWVPGGCPRGGPGAPPYSKAAARPVLSCLARLGGRTLIFGSKPPRPCQAYSSVRKVSLPPVSPVLSLPPVPEAGEVDFRAGPKKRGGAGKGCGLQLRGSGPCLFPRPPVFCPPAENRVHCLRVSVTLTEWDLITSLCSLSTVMDDELK